MSARRALFRQSFRDGRTRTLSFAVLFFFAALIQAAAYDKAYPTLQDKQAFAASFGNNAGIRIFYGVPHDLLTSGGYVSWRVGGTMALFLAVWGLLAGARVRAEEDAGREELVLAGPLARGTVFQSFVLAVLAGALVVGVGGALALIAGGLPVVPSLFLALSDTLVGVVFAGIGSLFAQLAPSRRTAVGLSMGAFALAFLIRVIADTTSAEWLRWLSPIGWAEEMQPFVGARPAAALVPIAASALLFFAAQKLLLRRDIGSGMFASHDRRSPKLGLLGSPIALGLRLERGSLLAWSLGVAAMALVFGAIAHSVTSGLTEQVADVVQNFGADDLTAQVYIGFLFVMYAFAACLFVCAHLAAVRHEESEGRLETELAEPVGRISWIGGRMLIAVFGVVAIGALAAIASWIGANVTGTNVGLVDMFEVALNCLPSSLLFLGLGALVFATLPRATSGVVYGLVSAAFIWWMLGSALDVPSWTLDLTPFHHIALWPAQSFNTGSALIMSAIGLLAIAAALPLFRRRDLAGA
ncbi:MAG: hypothetical protein QM648_02175 [Solirubrobacterales bacterium]